jgi:DNA polymerase II small subunit/DNA polymerase delta subunit B
MQSDFKIIRRKLDTVNDEAVLISLNDIHIGSEATDIDYVEKKLREYSAQSNVYFGLGGDFIDNGVKASKAGPYNQTMKPSEQKKEAARLFSIIRDKIIYILPGNHENKSAQEVDDNPAYDIASKLDLEDIYREAFAAVMLEVGNGSHLTKDRPARYYIAALHGSGGGRLVGAALNRAETALMEWEDMDILIMGHVHKLAASRPSKLCLDVNHGLVVQRDVVACLSGAWCNFASYAAAAMFRPSPKKPARITLRGDRKEFETHV